MSDPVKDGLAVAECGIGAPWRRADQGCETEGGDDFLRLGVLAVSHQSYPPDARRLNTTCVSACHGFPVADPGQDLQWGGPQRRASCDLPTSSSRLIAAIREMPGAVKVGFGATGGQEWALWTTPMAAAVKTAQMPPAQIRAFALSRGTRAKTDRICAELFARFMLLRPDAGRRRPSGKLRILRALTTPRAQIVDMRKR